MTRRPDKINELLNLFPTSEWEMGSEIWDDVDNLNWGYLTQLIHKLLTNFFQLAKRIWGILPFSFLIV